MDDPCPGVKPLKPLQPLMTKRIFHTMLSNKSSGKAGERGDICGNAICLPKQLLCVLRPCFSGSVWASASQWEVANEFVFLLCLHIELLLSILNCHYLNQWVFLLSFCFFTIWQERGVSKRQVEWLLAGVNLQTTFVEPLSWIVPEMRVDLVKIKMVLKCPLYQFCLFLLNIEEKRKGAILSQLNRN